MKFGIREICNVVLKAKKDGKILGKTFKKGQPVLWFDSLKTSGLEGTGEIVYARGGRGNTKLVSWTGDKDVIFNMEDALLSPMSLALLTAGSLANANENNKIISHKTIDCYCILEQKEDDETGETHHGYYIDMSDDGKNSKWFHELDKLVENTPVYGFYKGRSFSGMNGSSNAPLDIPVENENEDEIIIKLDFYTEETSKITQIDITPDSFGANFYLEAETLFRDDEKGIDHAAEFIIPNCRVQSNFSFTMASTGDPSTFTFAMDVFPDYLDDNAIKKVLCAIQVFEEIE